MFEKDRGGSVILSVGSFPRRGDHLFDPRDDISLSFPLLLLKKSKRGANKNDNKKNSNAFVSFSCPKEPKLFPPKSKEEITRW